jgi:hypothetical protein
VLEVVRHSDLAGRHEFPEVTPTEIERIDRDISPSRRQATLASLIAARRATVTFAYSLPNSYPYMRMNQISIFLPKPHKGTLKIFDLIEESHHESGVDV